MFYNIDIKDHSFHCDKKNRKGLQMMSKILKFAKENPNSLQREELI